MKKTILIAHSSIMSIATGLSTLTKSEKEVLVVVDREENKQEKSSVFREEISKKYVIHPYDEPVINIYPKKSKYASGNQKYSNTKFF